MVALDDVISQWRHERQLKGRKQHEKALQQRKGMKEKKKQKRKTMAGV